MLGQVMSGYVRLFQVVCLLRLWNVCPG